MILLTLAAGTSNIARRMTPEEIAAASRFYADHP